MRPSITSMNLFGDPNSKKDDDKSRTSSTSSGKKPPPLVSAQTLPSLSANFFQAPKPEETFADDPSDSSTNDSSVYISKNSRSTRKVTGRISKGQSRSTILRKPDNLPTPKEEKRKSIPSINNPIAEMYEEYIQKLHELYTKDTGSKLPSDLQNIHNQLREKVNEKSQSKENLPIAPSGSSTLQNESSIIPFPSDQHSYCHISESKLWKRKHVFNLKWNVETAQGLYSMGKLWWKSPQLFIHKKSESCVVRITLMPYEYSAVGFHLFEANGEYRQCQLPEGAYTSAFNHTDKLQEVVPLENEGPYCLVVCGMIKGPFKLVIEAKQDIRVKNPIEWEEWQVHDSWEDDSAGGCINNNTFLSNPQYLLTNSSSVSADCAITLCYTGEPESIDDLGIYAIKDNDSKSNNRRDNRNITSNLFAKSDFNSSKQAHIRFTMDPKQSFLIIPSTFDKQVLGSYELDVLSNINVDLLKLKPPDSVEIRGEWDTKTAGGCYNFPTWIDNVQYTFTTSESCKIQLSQDPNNMHEFGFYVVRSDGEKILTGDLSKFVLKSKFTKTETVSMDLITDGKKEPTTYTIAPCTKEPQKYGRFTLSLFSKSKKSIELKEVTDPWKEKTLAGQWAKDTSGGCFNYATWRNNTQYQLTLQNDGEVTVIVEQELNGTVDSIGCYIIANTKEDVHMYEKPRQSDVISKAKFRSTKSVHCAFKGKAGVNYTLIPCTFNPNIVKRFRMRVFSKQSKSFDVFDLENPALDTGRYCEGEWSENSSGGSMNNASWPSNPHYLLYADDNREQTVRILLSQKNEKLSPIGFSVTRADQYGLPHVEEVEDIVGKVAYEKHNDVSLKITLSASNRPYVVTPSTFKPGVCGKFVLQVFTEDNTNVMLMPWTSNVFFTEDDSKSEKDSEEYLDSPEFSTRSNSSVEDYSNSYNTSPVVPVRGEQSEELQSMILELTDRLEFYEKESKSFENKTKSLHKEIDTLKRSESSLQRAIGDYYTEIESLKGQLFQKEKKLDGEIRRIQNEAKKKLDASERVKNSLEIKLEAKESEVSELESKLENSLYKRDEFAGKISQLQTELTKHEIELGTQQEELDKQKSIFNEISKKEKETKQELSETLNNLNEIQKKLQSLQDEKESISQEYKVLQESNKNIKKEMETYKNEASVRQKELQKNLEQMSEKTLSQEQMENQLKLKDQLLSDLQKNLSVAESLEKDLKERLLLKENEVKQLQSEKSSLTKEKENVSGNISSLDKELKELQSKVENDTKVIKDLEEKLSKSKETNQKLKHDLSSLEAQKEKAIGEVDALKDKLAVAKEKLDSHDKSVSQQQEVHQSQSSELKEQVSQMESKIKSFENSIEDLQKELKEKEDKLSELESTRKKDNENHEKEKGELQITINSLKEKVEKFENMEQTLKLKVEARGTVATRKESEKPSLSSISFEDPNKSQDEKTIPNTPPPANVPPPPANVPPPPSIPKPPKAPVLSKQNKDFVAHTKSAKKTSILSAIRGGVNLREAKPEDASEKMKKSWIPFDVDKITQRREAMVEREDEEDDWSDDEDWE